LGKCEENRSFCIYFYPDHPDAGQSTQDIVDSKTNKTQQSLGSNKPHPSLLNENYLFCTYYYPDHQELGLSRIMVNHISTPNKTNNQKAMNSNESHIFPICENSSLFCTYLYVDKANLAGRQKKSNYSPAIKATDEIVKGLRNTRCSSSGTSTTSQGTS